MNLDDVIAAVSTGAAGSWNISNLGPRMIKRNFDPGFFVEHFIKDMGIALEEAKQMNLCLGHGRLGTQALLLALEQMNGLQDGISAQK